MSIRYSSFERVSIFIQLNRKRKKRNIVQRNQNRRKKKRRRKLRFYFLLFAEKWNKSEPVYWNLSEDTRPRLESIRFDPICFTPLPIPSPSNVNYAQLAAGQSTLEFYQLGILFDPTESFQSSNEIRSPPLLLDNARNSTGSTVFPNLVARDGGVIKGKRVCRQIVTGGTRLPPPLGDFTPLSYIS